MAKLVYVGPKNDKELLDTLKKLTETHNLNAKIDESCVAKLRETRKNDIHLVT